MNKRAEVRIESYNLATLFVDGAARANSHPSTTEGIERLEDLAILINALSPIPPGSATAKVDAAAAALIVLTDEQRVDLFRRYCRGCGCTDPHCNCENDE